MNNVKIYSEKQMNPILKNLFRAIVLLADRSAEFAGYGQKACFELDGEKSAVFYGGEEIRFASFLDAIEVLSVSEKMDDSDVLKVILAFIKSLAFQEKATVSAEELQRILNFTRSRLSTYRVGGMPQEEVLQDFYKKWMALYQDNYTFPITRETVINAINSGETKEYIKAFDRIGRMGEVPSIKQAIDTLIENIPHDTEKILDMGAGPGYVDERIPEYYQVLAMDIDSETLRRNQRPSCLGDALHIPLVDQAVDLTITCDMLEHIKGDSLDTVVRELKRVSAKYIYIQVPYQENLLAGMAYCPQCQYEWHVNYHKNVFDEERLLPLLGEGWKAVRINYTGEISYSDNLETEFRFLDSYGISCNMVEGWKCPKCDAESVKRNAKILAMLHRNLGSRRSRFPRYSEIGVLYCKDEYAESYRAPEPSACRIEMLDRKKIEFQFDYEIGGAFGIYDNRPAVFTSCRHQRTDEKHYAFEKEEGSEKGFVGFVFPEALQAEESLVIGGQTKEPAVLTICGNTLIGEEIKLDETEIGAGAFRLELKELADFCGCRIIKLYFDSRRIELEYAGFEGGESRQYRRICFDDNQTMFHIVRDGVVRSYYKGERAYIEADNEGALRETREPLSPKEVLDCMMIRENQINDLQKQLVSSREAAAVKQEKIPEKDSMQKNQIILNELVESFLAEQVKQQADNDNRQKALENLLVAQCIQNGSQCISKPKGNWKRKARALSDRVYITLIKTPFYELLVKLGAKKLYAKIRNRRIGN